MDKVKKGKAKSLKVLVVDDMAVNVGVLRTSLMQAGHTVIAASSGEEAIALFVSERPDVVLMDVMMPGIGGIEATRRMREVQGEHWVPIIFISALSHREDIVRGLDAGGDDYLTKPVDLMLLRAKINAMQRIAELEGKLRTAKEELQAYRIASEYELDMAKELMEHIVAESSAQVSGVELWLQPATNMSGDLVITQKYFNDRDYVLLADAMGHGLPAALPLVPLVQVFSAMTHDGFTISAIVREMNLRLKALLPVGNFVAVTLLCIDRTNRNIEVWNGGNPAALLFNEAGEIVYQFKSRHPAIGMLRGNDFDASTEVFHCQDDGWFAGYSDGMVDAMNGAGEEFGIERIVAALREENPYQSLKDAMAKHLEGNAAHDDISLVVVKLENR